MTSQALIQVLIQQISTLPNKADILEMLRQIQTQARTTALFGVTITADMADTILRETGA